MLLKIKETDNLTESSQNVVVTSMKDLTVGKIVNYMLKARNTKEYAKFIVKQKHYIMVIYNKDGTVNLVSNIKHNREFLRQLYWMERNGYSQHRWAYFIWFWLDRFINNDYLM